MNEDAVHDILSRLEEHGVCVVPRAIAAEQARGLRAIVDRLRERERRDDVDALGHQRVLHLAAKHPAFVELMCHPLAVAVFESYLGPDFICSTWTSNTVLPGRDLTYWHVDHPYWTIAPPYPVSPPLTAHAIWCLDDFHADSGGTRFILGSHRRDHLPEHDGDYDAEGVSLDAPAGSVIFAHGACWHSVGKNSTDQPRTGVFGRFGRSYIIPQEDMRRQLAALETPSPLVERLLCGKQYVPQRSLPY